MRTTDEIIHNGKTLTEILKLHKKWRNSEYGVSRANLSDADLSDANLGGANLSDADLSRAKYRGITIKYLRSFSGLYKYITVVAIADDGTEYIGLGCKFLKKQEWEGNGFWNNTSEFPDDNLIATKERILALKFANDWIELHRSEWQ